MTGNEEGLRSISPNPSNPELRSVMMILQRMKYSSRFALPVPFDGEKIMKESEMFSHRKSSVQALWREKVLEDPGSYDHVDYFVN